MKHNEIKLYYSYETNNLIAVLHNNNVYEVVNVIKETSKTVSYEINDMQTLNDADFEDIHILEVYKDRTIKECILDCEYLTIVNNTKSNTVIGR